MRTNGTTLGLLGVALVFAGCAYNPSPVPLEGPASEIAALAGTWEGTYTGRQSQRSGTISLTIRPGKDTAFGDVLMENPMGQPIVAWDVASGEHSRHSRGPQLLVIEFVGIHEDYVEGVMEPYIAPDCQCTVNTVFQGRRLGEEIEGEFVTRGPYGLYQTGTWKVRRTKTTVAEKQP
jgi:hypothetical protein